MRGAKKWRNPPVQPRFGGDNLRVFPQRTRCRFGELSQKWKESLTMQLFLISKAKDMMRYLRSGVLPGLVFLTMANPASALDPNMRITQYRHTAWRVQDGAFASAPNFDRADGQRLHLDWQRFRPVEIRWRSLQSLVTSSGQRSVRRHHLFVARFL